MEVVEEIQSQLPMLDTSIYDTSRSQRVSDTAEQDDLANSAFIEQKAD